MNVVANCLSLIGLAFGVASLVAQSRGKADAVARYDGLASAGYAGAAVCNLLQQGWVSAAITAALAVAYFWTWRRNRRKRKRSLRALGHKARARLAAMVRNMPKPGPVLRPVPQGSPS